MVRTSYLVGILLMAFAASAQYKQPGMNRNYVLVGSGMHAETGILGISYEHRLPGHFSFFVSGGTGTWGWKAGPGIRYYLHKENNLGSAFGLSYSYVAGFSPIKVYLEVQQNETIVGQVVELTGKPVNTVTLSWNKYYKLGKRTRFNIELGYSFLLNYPTTANYSINVPFPLSPKSQSDVKRVQPGGITAAMGFSFGF